MLITKHLRPIRFGTVRVSHMSGWQVMVAPLSILLKLGAIALVVFVVAGARLPRRGRPGHVADTTIVAAYNHAILQGWPPGEEPTFIHVGRVVGTVADHVRSVIARHWAT